MAGHVPASFPSAPEFALTASARSELKSACGNARPWKAWKSKPRISTPPTALGNRCAIPTFPHARRFLLYSLRGPESDPKSVTFVLGSKCYLCPRPDTVGGHKPHT